MSIALATKFAPYTDELFKAESHLSLLTNTDFDWSGAHTVKVYKISTVGLNDYARNVYAPGTSEPDYYDDKISRYGKLYDLNATTEELLLSKDRSFIFNVDKLDTDETSQQFAAATALAREIREVVIPEVDKYVYGKMVSGAGTTADAASLAVDDIYAKVLAGSEALDDNEIPEAGRVLLCSTIVYSLIKQAAQFDATEVGAEMRSKGIVGFLDGMTVIKAPSARLPENFGFMIAHPSATVAPVKLEDYGIHTDTPLSSGSIVTGRIVYDAFVLSNKAKGIYYQPVLESDSGSGS